MSIYLFNLIVVVKWRDKMKFYSEKTGELFDTVEELKKVEEEVQKKEEAKKAALAEVDEAYAEAVKAWNHYLEISKKHEQKKAYLPDDSFKTLLDILFK